MKTFIQIMVLAVIICLTSCKKSHNELANIGAKTTQSCTTPRECRIDEINDDENKAISLNIEFPLDLNLPTVKKGFKLGKARQPNGDFDLNIAFWASNSPVPTQFSRRKGKQTVIENITVGNRIIGHRLTYYFKLTCDGNNEESKIVNHLMLLDIFKPKFIGNKKSFQYEIKHDGVNVNCDHYEPLPTSDMMQLHDSSQGGGRESN